jgi:hypothetical protein
MINLFLTFSATSLISPNLYLCRQTADTNSSTMAWSAPDGILTRLLSGDPLIILLAFVVAFSLPLLLHLFLYQTSTRAAATPTLLLLGTSGAGKTSLLTLVSLEAPSRTIPPFIHRVQSYKDDRHRLKSPSLHQPEHHKYLRKRTFSCRRLFPLLRTSTDPRMIRRCRRLPEILPDIS